MSLLYVRTAKTASSTVNAWLGPIHSKNVTHNLKYLWEENNKSMIEKALDKNYFLFTTVRHPYTRTVSCWQQAIRSAWIRNTASFDEYLDWNFRGTTTHIETHNMPISEYLEDYLDKIHLFVKYENFKEKLNQMKELFEIEVKTFGHYNAKDVSIDYKELLTQERKDKIYELHKSDFDTFNYSKTIDF